MPSGFGHFALGRHLAKRDQARGLPEKTVTYEQLVELVGKRQADITKHLGGSIVHGGYKLKLEEEGGGA